jgi:hypothetical protein
MPINNYLNDFTTNDGVRVSLPIYVDVPMSKRKELLNGIRTAQTNETTTATPSSVSGISVETVNNRSAVNDFLGMNPDVLRGVLFQRGGLALDLVLKLQEIAEIDVLTEADIKKAFTARQKFILNEYKACKFVAA